MFKKAKRIWLGTQSPDTYADFITDFEYKSGKTELRISADSNYVAYINGKLVGFGQFADYPENKKGDIIDITEFVKPGENRLAIIVWYYGKYAEPAKMPFTYAPGDAGIVYEIEADGEIIAASDENTLSRIDPGYLQGKCETVTNQLGLAFRRDMTNADDSFLSDGTDGFAKSTVTDDAPTVTESPIKKLTLAERSKARLIRVGDFIYPDGHENSRTAHNMQFAHIAYRAPKDATDKQRDYTLGSDGAVQIEAENGIFALIDLGSETVGFLDIDIEVPDACRIDIGWGEHIADGRCRTYHRNFAITVDAKPGRNTYMNPFRRFGGRYIQLFIASKTAKIHYAGLRSTDYPLEVKPFDCKNLLRNTIYKVCTDTLRLCMHEHYEDCPWREQALYALDSRNQMLCGYFAFGEYRFARASLHLLGESIEDNGLLAICAPMKGTLNIPSFSLAYFISMNEYIKYSGDTTLANEMYEALERLLNTFTSRIDETGLIRSFEKSMVDWNFYEWSPTLSGNLREGYSGYEAALNLMLALAIENMQSICRALGKSERATELDSIRSGICEAVTERFWDAERKLIHTSDQYTDTYSVLVNAYALLTGALDGMDKTEVLRILTHNGKDENGSNIDGIIPNTLSMNCFRFDALLRENREKYKDLILSELDGTYLMMLRNGATSFWETERGEADFSGAGSLCHGWAALPVYYYRTLL